MYCMGSTRNVTLRHQLICGDQRTSDLHRRLASSSAPFSSLNTLWTSIDDVSPTYLEGVSPSLPWHQTPAGRTQMDNHTSFRSFLRLANAGFGGDTAEMSGTRQVPHQQNGDRTFVRCYVGFIPRMSAGCAQGILSIVPSRPPQNRIPAGFPIPTQG